MKLPLKTKYKKLKRFVQEYAVLLVFLALALGLYLGSSLGDLNFSFLTPNVRVSASESLSPRELNKALKEKDFTFINVHSPYDGEIAGTDLFLEHDLLKTNRDKLPEDRSAQIVLYCKSGNMSAQAIQTLKNLGYTNVSHLAGGMKAWQKAEFETLDLSKLPEEVIPEAGVEMPISWGNVGPKLVRLGVIDLPEFEKTMNLTDEQKQVLVQGSDSPIKITHQNSRFIVNMFWALGLAQKSKVYDEGPFGTEYKDSVGDFASTGGWSLAKGDAVNYLNRFDLIALTEEQQEQVYEIAGNVYRPCCGNSTAFPDCNHGMAALSAIELMVSKGVAEDEIYRNLLMLNSYWFSDTYLALATHMARQGINWGDVDAKLALSQAYSSSQGASELYEKVGPLPFAGNAGGSCGA